MTSSLRRSGTRLIAASLALALTVPAFASVAAPAVATAATFDPDYVICDSAFKDYRSMSRSDIQSFLDAMPGILKRYRARDVRGVVKPASHIIFDAARRWGISPKVILTMLQKEQGLLTIPNPSAERLREAMGCGVYSGSTNTYPGFGRQVWHGTRKLSQYPVLFPWHRGMRKRVYGNRYVTPENLATWCLYVYNPSIHGNEVFWQVYWRYFGDPHRQSWVRAVHRFSYAWNGRRVLTTSEGERYRLLALPGPLYRAPTDPLAPAQGGAYTYEGLAFTVNTRSAENTAPLYRVYNTFRGVDVYTPSAAERGALLADPSGSYDDRGSPFKVSMAAGADHTPVYRVVDTMLAAYVYTTSATERDALVAGPFGRYVDGGVGFYLAP